MRPVARWVLLLFATSVSSPPRAARARDAEPTPAPSSSAATPASGRSVVLWSESFRNRLDWRDPQDHGSVAVGRVYSVQQEGDTYFLRARHDAASKGAPPAIHFGKSFDGVPLARVQMLRWRWRAKVQPRVGEDPWEDMAASLYVVTRAPSLLRKGKGFKLGWLAKAGPSQTYQRGLLQVPVRSDAPGTQWRTEEVDLCAMYRRTFGACEDAQIIYIGVLTDADGGKSIAEGDYTDLELIGSG
jgi:Protein of unknown function (DUF3047)